MRTMFPVVLLLASVVAPAWAQDPAKPEAAPALKPGTFSLPPSAYDTNSFHYEAPADPSAGFSLPNRVDLGASTLKFDAGRKEPTNKVGIEAVDPTLLGDINKKPQSTIVPNYLGLTLSKPLN